MSSECSIIEVAAMVGGGTIVVADPDGRVLRSHEWSQWVQPSDSESHQSVRRRAEDFVAGWDAAVARLRVTP